MLSKKILAHLLGYSFMTSALTAQSFIQPAEEKTLSSVNVEHNESPENSKKHLSPAGQALPNYISSTLLWNAPCNEAQNAPNTLAIKNGWIKIRKTSIKDIEPTKAFNAQANVGVGFLYFSGLEGNLSVIPPVRTSFLGLMKSSPIKGRLMYNKTPVYEYILSKGLTPWLKVGFSYQNQSGVNIQTKVSPAPGIRPTLISNLAINTLMGKFYLEAPYPFIQSHLSFTPYLGAGVGVAWQSWNQITENLSAITNTPFVFYRSANINYNPVNNASAAFMVDMGMRLQKVYPYYPINVTFGAKFNFFGQARDIGDITKQANQKNGMLEPMSIKSVYQFAPYLGIQWAFSPQVKNPSSYEVGNRSIARWKPFFTENKNLESMGAAWTQLNGGAGFLYFKDIQGILKSAYQDNAFDLGATNQVMSYNCSPLLEYAVGFNPVRNLFPGISFQYQSNVAFQTGFLFSEDQAQNIERLQLRSNLSLTSLMFKVYYSIPYSMIMKKNAYSLYVAGGVGPGWQSWTDPTTTFSRLPTTLNNQFYLTSVVPIKNKYVANVAATADVGLNIQSAYANSPYKIRMGAKFNYWGSARNIGLKYQQGSYNFANQQFKIKHVYSWAPYLGLQWNFLPVNCGKNGYQIDGKDVSNFWPFVAKTCKLQNRTWFFTDFNVGYGRTYFSGVSANFMIRPSDQLFADTLITDVPLKGRLSASASPIFEYAFGKNVFNWLKVGLSYQHQSGIVVRSNSLSTASPTGAARINQKAVFTSNLALDALMIKAQFNSIWSFIASRLAYTPYLGVGGGVAWQSWTKPNINYNLFFNNGTSFSGQTFLRQNVCASGALNVDFGINIQGANPDSAFSIKPGCKFNLLGQARNVGSIDNESSFKYGFSQPLRIETVYQWAPYLGIEWNF